MRAAVEQRVRAFVADLEASPAADDVLAVVVSGSAAREEERWVDGELRSDIDLMVISRSSPLRLDRARAVQRVLADHADQNVEGGRIPVATLRYATLANYEARRRGVVVHGDASVLTRIPMAGPDDIPTWEAVRILANRLFEHLKLRAGMTTAEAATIKSYEAIGEAQLVLERRYEPSFAERAEAMRRAPLGGPVAAAQDRYLAAEGLRRGEAAALEATPEQALADLRLQLGSALDELGAAGEGPGEQLDTLARGELHLQQRLYWTTRGLGRRDGLHRPGRDPIFQLWRAALSSLAGPATQYDPRTLVCLWQGCPQILRKGVSPSS